MVRFASLEKCGKTERMLHGICRYAMAVLLRWANRDPWASCFNLYETFCVLYQFYSLLHSCLYSHLLSFFSCLYCHFLYRQSIQYWSCILSFISQYLHYENTPIQILPPKNWKFSDKNSDIFSYFFWNVDCGYSLEPSCRGGSNEYPQSMFLSRNMKNNLYPCKPQFYYIKVRFKESKLYRYVFVMSVSF